MFPRLHCSAHEGITSVLPPGCALDVQTGGELDGIGNTRITMVLVLWYWLPFRIGWAYHLFHAQA